jgi:hypothetical protein
LSLYFVLVVLYVFPQGHLQNQVSFQIFCVCRHSTEVILKANLNLCWMIHIWVIMEGLTPLFHVSILWFESIHAANFVMLYLYNTVVEQLNYLRKYIFSKRLKTEIAKYATGTWL